MAKANFDYSIDVKKIKLKTKIDIYKIAGKDVEELYNIKQLPLSRARIYIDFTGVNTAIVNAIRRGMDETSSIRLNISEYGDLTNDEFILEQWERSIIDSIPIKQNIQHADGIQLKLDITNDTDDILVVHSGDLIALEGLKRGEVLFNPNIIIAKLRPQRRIFIKRINIITGFGRDDAKFNIFNKAAMNPTDLEMHVDVHKRPNRDAEDDLGLFASVDPKLQIIIADSSGFKESSLITNPRNFTFSAAVNAVENEQDVIWIFKKVCSNIIRRLSEAMKLLDGENYSFIELESGVSGSLTQISNIEFEFYILNETSTLGELIKTHVFDKVKSLTYSTANSRLTFKIINDKDVKMLLKQSIEMNIKTFIVIEAQI